MVGRSFSRLVVVLVCVPGCKRGSPGADSRPVVGLSLMSWMGGGTVHGHAVFVVGQVGASLRRLYLGFFSFPFLWRPFGPRVIALALHGSG